MSNYSYDQFTSATDDGGSIDIWDAAFNNLHLYVTTAETITIDATWESNLPGLAAEKLGSRYLWWALLMYNGLIDPLRDVKPGVRLRIPDRSSLLSYMQSVLASSSSTNYLPSNAVTML